MNKFHIKSVILGIGIGIIIASVAGVIYNAGRNPLDELTKEQIISQAEKYGMVKPSVFGQNSDADGSGIFRMKSE